jgi:hypothetical protein
VPQLFSSFWASVLLGNASLGAERPIRSVSCPLLSARPRSTLRQSESRHSIECGWNGSDRSERNSGPGLIVMRE